MLALTLFRQMGRRFGNLFPVFYFHWLIYRDFYVNLFWKNITMNKGNKRAEFHARNPALILCSKKVLADSNNELSVLWVAFQKVSLDHTKADLLHG